MEVILKNNRGYQFIAKYKDYLLPLLIMVVAVFLLKDYFIPKIQIILAIISTPFFFKIKQPGIYSYGYGIVAIVLLLFYIWLQIFILLFLCIGCVLLFSIESQKGKVGILPFLFLVSISPALNYLVNISTFSIRMALSKYAALMLNKIGIAVENKGAYFIMPDGYSFSVDTACIGLNMFNTGLCMVLLLVGFSQQNSKKNIGFMSLVIIFLATVALLILTNLLRIVAIVFFRSAPGTFSHDTIGLVSLIIYTLIPVYFLIRFLTKRYGTVQEEKPQHQAAPFMKSSIISILLCIAMIVASSFVKSTKHYAKDQKLSALVLPGYSRQAKEDGVYEFRKDSVLIYIKPANKAYESDHPPALCWQGSGFQLNEITEAHYGNITVLKAILKRDSVTQYTAWWYDNGTNKTISQWEWRFSKGEPYRIINITTINKEELDKLCNFYLRQKLF